MKAGVLLVALTMSTVPGILRLLAVSSGYPSCCSGSSCPMRQTKPVMPAHCPMGSASSQGAKVCTCSVSQDPAAVAVQPDFRFDLPHVFSPALPWKSEARPAPTRVALLSGHFTPPDQPPKSLA